MALFTASQLRSRASSQVLTKSANTILIEAAKSFNPAASYDIFLSHSYAGLSLIVGLRARLNDFGFSVYVDWIEDSTTLPRSSVTRETAAVLRERMHSCRSLLYASSPNATSSKWMPWELVTLTALMARLLLCRSLTRHSLASQARNTSACTPTSMKPPPLMASFISGLTMAKPAAQSRF